jgi:hypothetical protein
LAKPWGKRSLRLAVSLGQDGARSEAQEFLRAFVSSEAPPPLQADDAETLAAVLRWAAIVALKSICAPNVRREPETAPPAAALERAVAGSDADGW